MNSGIYEIVNTVNNKKYYGSTCDFKERKKDHFKTLKSNTHRNPHLQNAYNKYGKENFQFNIIEFVEFSQLLVIEQKYLDMTVDGYNIAKTATQTRLGIPCSEETKRKISNSLKGTKLSLETRKKQRESNKKRFNGKHYWFCNRDKRYCVCITYLNKKISLGTYATEDEAKKVVADFMEKTNNLTDESQIIGNKWGKNNKSLILFN